MKMKNKTNINYCQQIKPETRIERQVAREKIVLGCQSHTSEDSVHDGGTNLASADILFLINGENGKI